MAPVPMVDSHVHFWNPQHLRYPWLQDVPALNRPFLPADLDEAARLAPAELRKIVFVEAGCEASLHLEEARWVTELAAREPRIRGIVANASVERGGVVREALAELARLPLVKGVRRLLQEEPDPAFCLQPAFVEGVRAVAEFGFTFDLCIFHHQLAAVIELVRRCPEVRFVLDHLAKPAAREQRLDPWRAGIRTLSALPNVVCKISGLATEADHTRWQPEQLRPYLEHVLDCFGFGRVLFGSDWPVATLAIRYARWVELVLEVAAAASDADRHRLFSGNAELCYRV